MSHAKLYSGNLITKIIGIGQSSMSKIEFLLISIANNSCRRENYKMKCNKKIITRTTLMRKFNCNCVVVNPLQPHKI